METTLEPAFPRPLSGAGVTSLPSGLVPPRAPLVGRHIRLEPLDPMLHGAELFASSHGTSEKLRIWDYLAVGPWPDLAAFTTHLRGDAASFERITYALRPAASEI